jgi:HSP20 family molecular chaperone IbpA
MASETEVTQPAGNGGALQQQRRGQKSEAALRPPVDIYETGEGITLQADMPGVAKDRLNVRVDGNTLFLEGNLRFELADQMEALYADVRSTVYRRSFVLSNELETDKIDANLKDGVLTVRIPKRPELRPRRIEVKAS